MCEMKEERFRWNVLDHFPYISDFAPSDFHLLGAFLKFLRDQHFRTYADFLQAVLMWLHKLDTDFYDDGFDGLEYRCIKVLKAPENYSDRCQPVVCDMTLRVDCMTGWDVKFCWIPSHMGIIGNEQAGIVARSATTHLLLSVRLCDMKRVILPPYC
ncbi:RNase H domain-containing protein [Trichonephila clavipes]|nr:RNase H domain-containing protein [Trichonephila clavipes]